MMMMTTVPMPMYMLASGGGQQGGSMGGSVTRTGCSRSHSAPYPGP